MLKSTDRKSCLCIIFYLECSSNVNWIRINNALLLSTPLPLKTSLLHSFALSYSFDSPSLFHSLIASLPHSFTPSLPHSFAPFSSFDPLFGTLITSLPHFSNPSDFSSFHSQMSKAIKKFEPPNVSSGAQLNSW